MNKTKYFLLILIFFFFQKVFAKNDILAFVSVRDLLNSNQSLSNISLQNDSNKNATIYGLYVRQYAYVLPGQSCSDAIVIYPGSSNITAGAYVTPVTINAGNKAAVGSNYLYNMIYQTIYYENIINPSSPPGCALPGCTWGSDSTQYNWCIYLGALAPVATSAGYTANVPPSADLASSTNLYNYNLITNYSYIGPISCNDGTLTCVIANQQTQAFS